MLLKGFLLRFEIARTIFVMTGTKNGDGAPIPAIGVGLRWGQPPCGYRGASSKIVFYILRPRGYILDRFWPVWLSVLALLRKAFAA